LRNGFKPNNLILTAAVAVGKRIAEASYEMNEIAKYLDFINLMAYGIIITIIFCYKLKKYY
jgi:GH18 family chitinase